MDILHTARLRLEPLTRGHAEALLGPLGDREVYAWIAEEPPADLETLRARFLRWEARRSPDGREAWLNWAVLTWPDARVIGYVQATVRDDGDADVAYVLGRAAWGQGYGREAVAAMLAHLAPGVTTFVATVDTRNRPSIALLEALGFARVGLRQGAEWIHGVLTDEAEYRLGAHNLR